jgi:hypothetical protein
MSLAVIDKLVQEKADQMPEAVFGLLLDRAARQHVCFANHHLRTNDCDCDYCRSLRFYVSTKLSLHRTKRKYLGDGYSIGELPAVEEKLAALQEVVAYQRQLKNQAAKI